MAVGVEAAPPPAIEFVTISRQEHIALKWAANYWQTAHRKAVDRFKWRELRYQRILRELKATGVKSNAKLQAELELAKCQVRDLQSRVYANKKANAVCIVRATAKRHLVVAHEDAKLDKTQCPKCGLAFNNLVDTEDSQVLEIEVTADRRVIHRHRYSASCQCGCVNGIFCAPAPCGSSGEASLAYQRIAGQVSLRPAQPAVAAGFA